MKIKRTIFIARETFGSFPYLIARKAVRFKKAKDIKIKCAYIGKKSYLNTLCMTQFEMLFPSLKVEPGKCIKVEITTYKNGNILVKKKG